MAPFSAVPTALRFPTNAYPGLTPWANFVSPRKAGLGRELCDQSSYFDQG
jgi:hypothetical protein